MGIYHESTVIGEVRAAGIAGRGGIGMSELRFTLAWNIFPKREHAYTVFGTSAWVSVASEGRNSPTPLGQAMPESAWCEESRPGQPFDRLLAYRLMLPSSQMMALEQLRQGGGLVFELDVRGNAHGPGGLCQVNETLTVTVNVSDWARVLKEAGAADVLLVGVHLPTESSGTPVRAAFELVRKANEHVVHGHYTAAVAECRRAIESLWKSAKLTDDARAARKRLATMGDQMTMTKRERELALGEAIRVFTHVAHHVGADAEPEVFGRLDAAMTVATTAGLVSSLSAQPDLVNASRRTDSQVSPPSVVSPQAMFDKVVERLRTNSANRPKTVKKLRSSFEAMVGRKLTEKEADALVDQLTSRNIISEVAGKLTYRGDI